MKVHQYNEMMRWLTRPKEDPSIKQLAASVQPKPGWQYAPWQDYPQDDDIPSVQKRAQLKPGGLVEPGVTHYSKYTDAEALAKFGDLLKGEKWSNLTKKRKKNISTTHIYYTHNPERLGTGQVQPSKVFIPKEELIKLQEKFTNVQIAKKKNISDQTLNRILKEYDLIDLDYNLPLEKQYKIEELNKATEHFTEGKLKKFNDLHKLSKKEQRRIKSSISQDFKRKKGKFDIDPKGGQFKKIYFKDYSDKDFIKDLKNKKSPYEIAENYYAKNKKFVNKQMLGKKEYTKPIGYLSKVLGLRSRANPEVAKALKKYRAWSALQKGPTTFEAYTKRTEKLIPLAIEQGIIPKHIKTSADYYNYVKKTRINPLMGLFNHLEKIGIEHIGGISRALELSDAKTLQEIVPLLGGHEVNVAKGWKYDRPMTGLVRNILKSEFPTQKIKNLEALNKKAQAASKAYHVPVSEYKLGKKGLERITSGKTLAGDMLTDADLLMQQYAAKGGEKRASFKHLDPDVQKTIKMYEAGNIKEGKKQLKTIIEKIGCGKAAGGRVGFGTGGDCFKKGIANIKNNNIKSPAQAKNMLKLAETGAKSSALRAMLGVYGLAGEAIIEAGIGAYKVLGQGVPANIAWSESYWSYLDPRKYTGELSNLRRKDLEKRSPRIAKYYDALDVLEKRDYHSKWVNQMDPNDPTHKSHVNKLNQYDEIIRNFYGGPRGITNMMERVRPEVENAEAEQAGKWAADAMPTSDFQADRKQKLAMKEYMLARGIKTMPYTKDGKPVYKKDFDMMPTRFDLSSPEAMADLFIDDAWAREAIKEHAPRLYGKASERQYIPMAKQAIFSDMRKDPEYNKMVISESMRLDPSMLGTQERFNTGGRVGFKLGGIDKGRRAFLQWLAGITGATVAAGTGLIKWGKVAGKGKTAIKAGDHIVQGTQGMPDWFIPLINRITKEGDDVTKKLGTVEREIVHTKEISKGEHAYVYQNLDTGNVRVEYHSAHSEMPIQMEYKAPVEDITSKGKPIKTEPEFQAVESEPKWEVMGPDDADLGFDGENIVGRVEDLTTDTSKLKEFGKNKKLTIKEKIEAKKKQDYRKSLEHDSQTAAEYLEGRYGPYQEPDVSMDEFGNLVDEYGEIID